MKDDFLNRRDDNGLIVGKILKFLAFTSTSSNDLVATTNFGSDVVYVITLNHDIGVDISQISCFQYESEVLLIPPASFKITQICMQGGSLMIHLESVANEFCYLRM